jgi:microcin C transport system permease protein
MIVMPHTTFDFGSSFFKGQRVVDLVIQKLPVSISLGLSTTLIIYLISIPLGIRKAVREGSRFDIWTSAVILVGSSIPQFIFAVLLLVLFAGSSFLSIFPLQHLTSDNYDQLSFLARILDRLWHLSRSRRSHRRFATIYPVPRTAFSRDQRSTVVAARAKGLTERRVFYSTFRNAMCWDFGLPGRVRPDPVHQLVADRSSSLDGIGLLGLCDASPRLPDHVRDALLLHLLNW